MALSAEGRCVALGTVTLVQLGDRRALLTAAHVASGIAQRGGEIRLLHTRGKEIDDTRDFACDLDVLWRSDDLDVALLAPPLDLLRSADAEWFDLDRQRRLVQALRQVRHTFDSEDASLPYFAIGVPNFGRISFESFRVESLGIMSIPAYVSQLETDPWSGDAAIVPQMHLELDANELDPDFAPDDPFGAHAYARVAEAPPVISQALGGLSGGPVVYIEARESFLIGVIKQGAVLFEQKRAVATPIDDVLTAIGSFALH
jgi:hypothetical protein